MRSETVTAVLSAPQKAVFEYMSDIARLPEWATRVRARAQARRTGLQGGQRAGRVLLRDSRRSRDRGDRHVRRSEQGSDGDLPNPCVPLPDGRTAFTFTMFQGAGMPDELFESQHQSRRREFANIAAVFAD